MLAHKHFGIQTPLFPPNPYKISPHRLLMEGISVPSGVMACLEERVVLPWIRQMSAWLLQLEIPAEIKRLSGPPAEYVVKGIGNWRNLLSEEDIRDAPQIDLSLETICYTLNEIGNTDGLVYEFVDLIRSELGDAEAKRLAIRYPVLKMDRK
jgi:hypothetical protein